MHFPPHAFNDWANTMDQTKGVMNWTETIQHRHSVRMYTDQPVEQWKLDVLQSTIDDINLRSGFAFQMVSGVEDALLGLKPHYGRFTDVHNAVAFMGDMNRVQDVIKYYGTAVGYDDDYENRRLAFQQTADAEPSAYVDLASDESALTDEQKFFEQAVGYYGEYLVLVATKLGLASSWVVLDQARTAQNPW